MHVVGGGPTGSIAAISAARNGSNVILSEEHERSGIPVNCSGLFSKDGLESLSDFFDYKKFIVNRIKGAVIDLAGEKVEIKSKEDVGFVCDRGEIDAELANNAEDEGVKIEYGRRVLDGYYADNIIGADGPSSSVAMNFNFPKLNKYVGTFQADVEYPSENPEFVEIFLSNSLFPGFFGWVIPKNEEVAEMGCGCVLPNSPMKSFANMMRIKKLKKVEKAKGWVIPIKWRETTSGVFGKKNVLLVGDAAGQVKSTTGGGVIFGGNCASLAGRYADNPNKYESEWRVKFGVDLFLHQIIQNNLEGRSDRELKTIGKWMKNLKLDEYLSKKGHMDKPSRIVRPDLLVHFLRNL